jgi:hypothetical protein
MSESERERERETSDLSDAKDDGELHLEGVEVRERVLRAGPPGVHTCIE